MSALFSYRQKIEDFETQLKLLPQADFQTKHEFCDGLYARTMTVPEGVAIIGAIHASENFLFVRTGKIAIWLDESSVSVFRAGTMVSTRAGHKRVMYALETTVLTTVHANPHELREPEELWEYYTLTDYKELEQTISLKFESDD